MSRRDSTGLPEQFHTTRWTRVLAARGDEPDSKTALSELCEVYYRPVHAFIRHTVRDVPADRARDLTHEFFARLLAKPGLDSLDRERGRFRGYLLGAVKHFLADWRAGKDAAKRGGGRDPVSFEDRNATGETGTGSPAEFASPATSDAVYDREWALAVLGRALDNLAAEHEAAGTEGHFETLKSWLSGDDPSMSQADAARRLGISDGAVKVAIHRLRKRFRILIKAEIAQTVETEAGIGEELNHLIQALSSQGPA